MDESRFKSALRACRFVTESEWNAITTTLGPFFEKHPEFDPETGVKILKLIQDNDIRTLHEDRADIDSADCAYFYVVDMDNKTVTAVVGRDKRTIVSSTSFTDWTRDRLTLLDSPDQDEEE